MKKPNNFLTLTCNGGLILSVNLDMVALYCFDDDEWIIFEYSENYSVLVLAVNPDSIYPGDDKDCSKYEKWCDKNKQRIENLMNSVTECYKVTPEEINRVIYLLKKQYL